jgi:ABC-type multidrug transport system fused ATPase/permease subunit
MMRGRTIIMISHRSSTIRDASRALVFSDGKLIQNGAHQELLAVPGLYRTLMSIESLQHQVSTGQDEFQ